MRFWGVLLLCAVVISALSSFAFADVVLTSPSASPQFLRFSTNSTNITVIANETLGGNITQVNASFPASICNGASPANMTNASLNGLGLWWYNCVINWSAATNNTYVLNLTATNGTATNTTTVNFTIDTVNPAVAINSPASGANLSSRTLTINVTATDNVNIASTNISVINSSGSVVNYTVNTTNGTYVVTLTVPADGVYTINATSNDSAGNSNTATNSNIRVDATVPTVAINSPASNSTSANRTLTISITATDSFNISSTNISVINSSGAVVNSTLNATNGAYNVTLTVPADGVYNITANATDTTGNSNTATNYNITIDTIAPNITSITLLEPDIFYSDWPSQEIINVNVTVNGTGSSLLNVTVSLLNMSQSAVMTANMTNNVTFWWASFNISSLAVNATNNNPVLGHSVYVQAVDQAFNTRSSNEQGYNVTMLVHRLGSFQGPPDQFQNCMRESPETTNLSRISNFNAVNLVQAMMLNGSAACAYNFTGINQSLPWGDTFKSMGKFNFSSVNISTQAQAQAVMSAPGQNIRIQISPPRSFGTSRIYVNSTALAALNTNTTITLYDLPFGSTPVVINDTGGTGGIVLVWSQGPYNSSFNTTVGNLSITVNGFSGYNISDNSTPTITFNAPTNSSNWANLVNLTINGTGSEVSYVNFTLNGTTYRYNYSNSSINTANCTQASNGSERTNCILTNITLAAGNHTLNVTAYDFGGTSGNSLNSYVSFYNNSAPTVASFTLTNASVGHWFYANATITDLNGGSDVNNYTVNITSGSCAYISQANTSSTAVFAFNCSGTAGNSTNISINFKDSINQSVNTSTLSNTFPNNAPSISAVTITPTTVYNFTNGSCNVTATDTDGDTLTYNYVWYLNGTANVTTQNISTSAYALSNITCQAIANDSANLSSATNSSTAFVLHSSSNAFVVNGSNITNSTQTLNYSNSSGTRTATVNISNGTTITTPSNYTSGFVFVTNFSTSSGDLGGSSAFGLNILLGPANSSFSPNITVVLNYSGLSAAVQTSIETANTAGYLRVKKCNDTGGSCETLTPTSVDTTNNLIYVNISNFSTLGLYDATPASSSSTTTTTTTSGSTGGGSVSRGVPPPKAPETAEPAPQPAPETKTTITVPEEKPAPSAPTEEKKAPARKPAATPPAPAQAAPAPAAPAPQLQKGFDFLPIVLLIATIVVIGGAAAFFMLKPGKKKGL